ARRAGNRAMDTTFGSGIRHPDRVEFEQDYAKDGGGRSNCNWHNIPRFSIRPIILSRLPDHCGALFLLWVGSSHRVHPEIPSSRRSGNYRSSDRSSLHSGAIPRALPSRVVSARRADVQVARLPFAVASTLRADRVRQLLIRGPAGSFPGLLARDIRLRWQSGVPGPWLRWRSAVAGVPDATAVVGSLSGWGNRLSGVLPDGRLELLAAHQRFAQG